MPTPSQDQKPSFLRRIPMAFGAFFSLLGNADKAARYGRLDEPPAPVAPPPPPHAPVAAPKPAPTPKPAPVPAPPPVVLREATPDAALQLLALLQREARFIDFVQENLAGHPDADIGAAARLVHEGCRKVLGEHFRIEPVRTEAEGSRITLQPGFDAASVKLTGNVVGQPPFSGTLSHRGWRASEVKLPKLAEKHDARVLAQAEVEL